MKFKGWESVRWFEERIVPEHERPNIANHLIFQSVNIKLLRCSRSAWTALTLKIIRVKMTRCDLNMWWREEYSNRSLSTTEKEPLLGLNTFCTTLEGATSLLASTPSPSHLRLEKITLLLTSYLSLHAGQIASKQQKRKNKIRDAGLYSWLQQSTQSSQMQAINSHQRVNSYQKRPTTNGGTCNLMLLYRPRHH